MKIKMSKKISVKSRVILIVILIIIFGIISYYTQTLFFKETNPDSQKKVLDKQITLTGGAVSNNGECSDGVDNDNDGLIDWQYDLGCTNANDEEVAQTREEENGWTTYDPSPNSRIIYVSSSEGDDNNNGFSSDKPVKTISKAYNLMRDGFADWMLLKRGDFWNEALTSWQKEGTNSKERMIISSYGESTKRPVIIDQRFNANNGGKDTMRNFAIIGIEFYCRTKDPNNSYFTGLGNCGISMLAGENVTLEDLKFSYGSGIIVQDYSGIPTNIEIRRSIIEKTYSVNSHMQGIFTHNVNGLLIEENTFYHNGWSDEFRLVLWASNKNISQWKKINDGRFGITLKGMKYEIENLDFSSTQEMVDVASIIEQALKTKTGDETIQFKATNTSGTPNGFVLKSTKFDSNSNYQIRLYNGTTSGTDIDGSGWLNSGAQGVPESTIFNRNMYLSFSNGKIITRKNIDAMGASGGIQQREGGISTNNLFLRDPHAIIFGTGENQANTNVSGEISWNVALDSMNIDTQVQGTGYMLESTTMTNKGGYSRIKNLEVHHNIVAHNKLGTGNIKGIAIQGDTYYENLDVHDNIIYDWSRDKWPDANDHRAHGFTIQTGQGSKNAYFRNNIIQQINSGFVGSTTNNASGIILQDNTYWSAEIDSNSVWSKGWFNIGSAVDSTTWFSKTDDTNSKLEKVNFPNPDRNIESYMASLGEVATFDEFISRATEQSKLGEWEKAFTAEAVNDYIREGFGMQKIGGTIPLPNKKTNISDVTSNQSIIPLTPQNFTGVATNSKKIDLTWREVNESTNYILEKSMDGGGTWTIIATLDSKITQYIDKNLTTNTIYSYRIKARNSIGDSQYSTITLYTKMTSEDFNNNYWEKFDDAITTNLTINTNVSHVSNLHLGKKNAGIIKFLNNINFLLVNTTADIDYVTQKIYTNVIINNNSILIDSESAPELNKSAQIILYNLEVKNPLILRDGKVCSQTICTIKNYTNGTITFEVTQFSTYTVVEGQNETSQQNQTNNNQTENQTQQNNGEITSESTITNNGGGGGGGGSFERNLINIFKIQDKDLNQTENNKEKELENNNLKNNSNNNFIVLAKKEIKSRPKTIILLLLIIVLLVIIIVMIIKRSSKHVSLLINNKIRG